MWVRGSGVVNAPTDGRQRSLVNHWGVIASGEGPPRSCVARDVAKPEAGVRRHVKSPEVMTAWRFGFGDINLMSKDDLAKYAEGPALDGPPRFLQHSDKSLWLVDQGTKRHVTSFYAIATWRLDVNAVEKNADAELARLPAGPPVRELPHLVVTGDPAVWLIDTRVPPPAGTPGADAGVGSGGVGGGVGGGGGGPAGSGPEGASGVEPRGSTDEGSGCASSPGNVARAGGGGALVALAVLGVARRAKRRARQRSAP